MKHFDRLLLKIVIFLGLVAGSLAAYTKGEHFFNDGFYIVRENGETFPASSDQFGIEKSKADFLTHFRKNISPESVSFGRDNIDTIKEHIKSGLLEDYARDGQRLSEWTNFSSDRERFIAYLMLRVNGSLPAFYPAKTVSDDLRDILLSKEGNCSHQAYRLLMVLDIFSIQGQLVSWWSPAIEGHVFVDAVDPIEGRSYFLDPTSNLMASTKSDEQNLGFLQSIEKVSPSNRKAFLSTRMKEFPNFVTASQGLNQDFMVWSLNNYLRAKDSIITGFSFELPVMKNRWRDGTSSLPKTLCELAEEGSKLLQAFQPTGCLPPAVSPM